MSTELDACVAAVRARLRDNGLDARAPVETCEGLLCGYRDGVVRITLPTLSSPEGVLRSTMLGAMMGLDAREVAWLFEALLPRLVAHELGHALRDEAGLLGDDVCAEEQIADRVATLAARTLIDARDVLRAKELLSTVTARLGGVALAASLHRHSEEVRRKLGLTVSREESQRARAALQTDYWRDVSAYLRLTSAWAWLDLTLDEKDDFDAICRDHFSR